VTTAETTDENFSDSSAAPFPGRPFVFSDVRLSFWALLLVKFDGFGNGEFGLCVGPFRKNDQPQHIAERGTDQFQGVLRILPRRDLSASEGVELPRLLILNGSYTSTKVAAQLCSARNLIVLNICPLFLPPPSPVGIRDAGRQEQVFGDVAVSDPARSHFHDHENVQHPKAGCYTDEEITSDQLRSHLRYGDLGFPEGRIRVCATTSRYVQKAAAREPMGLRDDLRT